MRSHTKVNVLLLISVLIASALLLFWLFAGTTFEEEANPVVFPSEAIE